MSAPEVKLTVWTRAERIWVDVHERLEGESPRLCGSLNFTPGAWAEFLRSTKVDGPLVFESKDHA